MNVPIFIRRANLVLLIPPPGGPHHLNAANSISTSPFDISNCLKNGKNISAINTARRTVMIAMTTPLASETPHSAKTVGHRHTRRCVEGGAQPHTSGVRVVPLAAFLERRRGRNAGLAHFKRHAGS